ncbi:MAG: hypothetical protein IJP66_02815 [Kiritimatiellae bacterium]|nr:hypothetical protein [Kiritimatiellia bacterium]
MKAIAKTTRLAATAAIALAALLAGCESSDDSSGSYWTTENKSSSAQATASTTTGETKQTTASETSATSVDGEVGAADQVPFGSLSWSYGGVNGAKAAKTTASISGLSAGSQTMSYRWTGDTLRTWGLSDGNAGALACFFVQRSDGRWVGGKFDWVSTSRTSRGLENIYAGYRGWTLSGVPNPCLCAFVIISSDGKKRTNVITGTWRR